MLIFNHFFNLFSADFGHHLVVDFAESKSETVVAELPEPVELAEKIAEHELLVT